MNDDFDIDRARSETRGCEQVVHFNNAGSSLMPIPVADALQQYL
ncbi:MAG: aminotransferase, partial [Pseudomonadota bacterium]